MPDNPVTFRLGRPRLVVAPAATGSSIHATIGIVLVARCASRTPGPTVTITSMRSPTSSCIRARKRSGCPSAERRSMEMLRPSMCPRSRRPFTNPRAVGSTGFGPNKSTSGASGKTSATRGTFTAGCALAPNVADTVHAVARPTNARRLIIASARSSVRKANACISLNSSPDPSTRSEHPE